MTFARSKATTVRLSWWNLFYCFCIFFHLQATAADVDTDLETKLDHYLTLPENDIAGAEKYLLSLESALQPQTSVFTKTRLYIYLSSHYSVQKQQAKAEEYLKKVSDIADEMQHPDIYAELYAERLSQHWANNENSKASELVPLVQQFAARANNYRVRYYAFNTVGRFLQWQGNYKDSLAALHQALDSVSRPDFTKVQRNKNRQIFLKLQIAALNQSLRNYDAGLKIIRDAINSAQNDPTLQSMMSDLYNTEGLLLTDSNQNELAAAAYRNSESWGQKLKNNYAISTAINNLGDLYLRTGEYQKAMIYFTRAYTIAKEMNDEYGMEIAEFNQGAILVRQGQAEKGLPLMQTVVDSNRARDAVNELLPLLEELADAFHIAKDFEKEAATLREYNQLNKKLFQIERDKQLNQLQEEFSAKEKAKQIEVLEQQNLVKAAELDKKHLQQKVFMLVGIVVLLASGMLFQLYRRVRKTNSKLRVANDKLAYHSLHDPLTGLLNRRSLHDHMHRKTQMGERRANQFAEQDGFILLDVDFFKPINDSFGHAAGDFVLIEIGKRLKALTRSEDMVLRWGGEEFLLVLRRIDQESLNQFTQRVLNAIGSSPIEFQGQEIPVTVSAGFIPIPFADLTEEQLNWEKALQLADMALYLGKVHGRNRAYGLLKLNKPYAEVQQQLESDLSKAMDEGLVEVCLIHGPSPKPAESHH